MMSKEEKKAIRNETHKAVGEVYAKHGLKYWLMWGGVIVIRDKSATPNNSVKE